MKITGNFCGLKEALSVYCGSWSDPLVIYKEKYYNEYDIYEALRMEYEAIHESQEAEAEDIYMYFTNNIDIYDILENMEPDGTALYCKGFACFDDYWKLEGINDICFI